MKLQSIIIGVLILSTSWVSAQSWVSKMEDRTVNFYTIQQEFDAYWGNKPYKRGFGWKQFRRWEDFWEPRVYPHGYRPAPNYVWQEHQKFERNYPTSQATKRTSNWQPLGPSSWTSNSYNPGAGRINAIAEDPNNPNVLYVGTPSGGCWKSTDGGSSWTPLTDHFPALGVSAIAIDYTNSNVLYIGTGDDDGNDTYSVGVFKSTDAGNTWSEITPSSASLFGTSIRRIIIHPTNNNILYLASSSGCFKSTDGGSTWSLLRAGGYRDMELHPTNPNIVYLSSDSFFKSTDGGNTWQTITTGLPDPVDVNRAEIAVSPDDSSYVYFLCGKSTNSSFLGLYRSTNAGTSFALQANSPNLFAYDDQGADLSAGQSWYDMALTVSPSNADEVYVGGINVWKSTDGGQSFTIKTHWYYPPGIAYVHADIHTLDFFGNNLYCGSDGGVFKSTNGGTTFADLSAGLEITQLYRIDDSEILTDRVIGGTQDNGCNIIRNNAAWHIRGADGMEVHFAETDTNVVYTSSQYGGFRRSNDGGFNSVQIFPNYSGNGAWVTPLAMNAQDNDMLLAGFDQVILSLDKGTSSTVVSNFNLNNELLRHVAIAPSAGYTHFYAATYNRFFATANGGASWSERTSSLPLAAISSITVHPQDPLKIYLTFSGTSGTKVYTSDNGGATWTDISKNLPNIPVNCLVYQDGSNDGIYVGTDMGIYYTDTLLVGWQPFMTGLPNVIVRDMEINYATGRLIAGTYGRGIWVSPLKPPLTNVPTANFNMSNSFSCVNDSIAFTDLSVDHGAGWQWFFPGGSPSSSTQRNPKTVYPSSGVYDVTLVVQNINGYDTLTKAVPIQYAPNLLNFDLQLDNNAGQTSWRLLDSVGNTLINSGFFAGQDSQLVQTPICLEAGCYKLSLLDFGGDGICCGPAGQGYYLLTDNNGDTLGLGGSFGNTDTINFCVNQTAPLLAGTNIQNTTCGSGDGQLVVVAIGGDGNYTYSIDGGNTFTNNNTFTSLSAGNYTILVEDGTGAQVSVNATVGVSYVPQAVASVSTATVYLNQGGSVNFFSNNSSHASSYVWRFPDGSTSTQASPSYTFATEDTFQVILEVTNGGCMDADTLSIVVINNVNINVIEKKATIAVIPNPVNERFRLEVDFAALQEDAEIIIHNTLGKAVYWEKIHNKQRLQRDIHFGNEPDGVYIITILNKDMAISKKFVKGS